jgi:hypothetical protein
MLIVSPSHPEERLSLHSTIFATNPHTQMQGSFRSIRTEITIDEFEPKIGPREPAAIKFPSSTVILLPIHVGVR